MGYGVVAGSGGTWAAVKALAWDSHISGVLVTGGPTNLSQPTNSPPQPLKSNLYLEIPIGWDLNIH